MINIEIRCPNCGKKMSAKVEKNNISKIIVFCSTECSVNYSAKENEDKIKDRFEIMDL
ncbi:MAG TPA: hypothetical protein VMZ91_08895 [Candidatus Paceibacterota bacterium]|nr:hypothetical protein [Candidatus Paceibacterota bacterium]